MAAPAEAAAEHQLVHLAFVGRQAGRFQHRRERGLAVLRAGPDLAFVRRVERRGVHRLHRGVVLVGIVVDRLDLLGGAGDGGLGVAVLVADEGGCASSRPSAEPFRRSTRSRPWRSRLRPRRSAAHRARSWRATRCRRRRRRAVSPTCTTFLTPFMPMTLASSKLFSLPPNTGQSLIAAFSMPGSLTSMP